MKSANNASKESDVNSTTIYPKSALVCPIIKNDRIESTDSFSNSYSNTTLQCTSATPAAAAAKEVQATSKSNYFSDNNKTNTDNENRYKFKCICEWGVFDSGIFKSLGRAEAIMNMGIGGCYHRKGMRDI